MDRRRGREVSGPNASDNYIGEDQEDEFDFADNEELLLEQQQLQRAEEIRRALAKRDEKIEELSEKLKSTQMSLKKYKSHSLRISQELENAEAEVAELRKSFVTSEEELHAAQETERRLRKEKEKLEDRVSKLSASENEVKSLREDVKRLTATETKMKQDISHLEERYELELSKVKERSLEHVRHLEAQLKHQQKKIYELEGSLHEHHDRNIQNEISLKDKSHLLADCEKRYKEESRKANELEKRFQAETKRVDNAEQRLREETLRANEAEHRLGEERSLYASELNRLRETIAVFEEKTEKHEQSVRDVEQNWQLKLDQVSRELKRKNAQVFELENKLNGVLFVAERKMTKVEKEAAHRVKSAAKQAEEAQRSVEDREKKALQVLSGHKTLVQRIDTLEARMGFLFLQRDWLVSALEEHRSLLIMIERDTVDPNSLESGTVPVARRHRSRGLRAVAWAVVFTLILHRGARNTRSQISRDIVFVWSPMLVLVKSREHLRTRVNAAKIVWDELARDSSNVQKIKRQLAKSEQKLNTQGLIVKELRGRAAYFEAQAHDLHAQLSQLQDEIVAMQSSSIEREAEIAQLHDLCAQLQREKEDTMQSFSADQNRLGLSLEDTEKRSRKLATKARSLQNELESERAHRKVLMDAVAVMERERDDARAEARALGEMVTTLEKYAEAEISSLTRMVETDRWNSVGRLRELDF